MTTQPKISQLTFMDVLYTRAWVGDIDILRDMADKLGYPYFLWNGQVFKVEAKHYSETGLTENHVI